MSNTPANEWAQDLLVGTNNGPWGCGPDENAWSVWTKDRHTPIATDVNPGDAALIAAAPELAEIVAGLTEEWGVQIGDQGLACMVFLNGTTDIWGTEKHARAEYAVQASRFDGAARMVRRYVSAGAVAE